MNSKTSKRYRKTQKSRTALTLALVLLSGAAFGTEYFLKSRQEEKIVRSHAAAELVSAEPFTGETLEAGASESCVRGVKVTDGEGFVRFRVTLLDSDGVPFNEKLAQQKKEYDELDKFSDSEAASYKAFKDTMLEKENDYKLIEQKGELALSTFLAENGDPVIKDCAYTSSQIDALINDGYVTKPFDGGDFTQVYDKDTPFERTLVYNKKVSAGESCMLCSSVVIPSDWTETNTTFNGHIRNEDGDFEDGILYIGNMELLGEGYTIKIAAEIVPVCDFEDPLAAFYSAEH